MATSLRLMRFGKKGHPFYRIVAIDKRKKRDGSYIERIGSYDPMTNPAKVELDKTRFEYWQNVGAEISEGFRRLLKNPARITYKGAAEMTEPKEEVKEKTEAKTPKAKPAPKVKKAASKKSK